jgi:hypothetical protein
MRWADIKGFFRARKQEMLLRSAAIGMDSTVDIVNDRHILVLDYDVRELSRVVASVEELQQFWNLSDVMIFRTKNGFHAFGFYDIMPFGRLRQIIEYAKDVDPLFKALSYVYRHKTVRVEGKHPLRDIQFVGIISGLREPTQEEWDLGEMKRMEHLRLVDPEGIKMAQMASIGHNQTIGDKDKDHDKRP